MKLAAYVDRLLALDPGSKEAAQQQEAIEHILMAALRAGGRDAGEALVDSLTAHGYDLRRIDALPCMWRVLIPRPRVLELWFTGGDRPAVAALSYRVGAPWGTKRQKRAAELQAAFYARYEPLAHRPHSRKATLSREDRLIVSIGDLEGDVNNGGFRQYVSNKGATRAQEALAGLVTIGARRTARWLSAALKLTTASADLDRLDQAFYEMPEDLPALVMRYIVRHSKGSLPSRSLPNRRY